MQENIRSIASRIRELREIAGISPETLAHDFNIPRDTYLEYESGGSDIPVSFLCEVANRFKVDLTDLLTGESPRLHKFAVVRNGKGIGVERRKQYKYESLAHNFIHKRAEPFLVTVEPGMVEPASFNSHPGQEFNYVLEGSLKVVIDGHELLLNEGDSLYFDATCSHGMIAMNGKPARFLAVIL